MLIGEKRSHPLRATECLECFMCYDLCPTGAISMTEPFCRAACPLGMDVPSYVDLVSRKRYGDAYELMKRYTPLPAVLGYICHHPCELKCRRKDIDEAVAIRSLKRFAADYKIHSGTSVSQDPKGRPKGRKVAVVGSGPAGLTAAYFLAGTGYAVTVFEALPVIGGMLAALVPRYRLPDGVLQYELDQIRRLGVSFETNTRFGRDVTLDRLKADGYEAFFMSLGTHGRRRLGIPNEDLAGVVHAVDFLKDMNGGQGARLSGKAVTVIGGGKVGIDAARSACRLGAAGVRVVELRGRADLPDCRESIEEAEAEGIELHWLLMPRRFSGGGGRANALECQRMAPGSFRQGGLRELVALPETTSIAADLFIVAIGQVPDLQDLPDIRTTEAGLVMADRKTLQTNIEGVFAGGDCVTGTSSVVEAMAMGRRAAGAINGYFGFESEIDAGDAGDRAGIPDIEAQCCPREPIPVQDALDRAKSFSVVELGYSEDQAVRQAGRCSRCGKSAWQ